MARRGSIDGSDSEKIFDLGSEMKRGTFVAALDDETVDPLSLLRGEVVLTRPPALHWSSGSRLYDLIETDDVFLYLLSSRAIEVLSACGASGWSASAVRLFSRDRKAIPGYSVLSVAGRCGPTLGGWDGSDVFVREGTGRTLVTTRVREAVQTAALKNFRFTPVYEGERRMLFAARSRR